MPVANRRSLSDQFEYDFWSREGNAGLYSVRLGLTHLGGRFVGLGNYVSVSTF